MSRIKVATLLSILTFGVTNLLSVSTVLASEMETVSSEQVKDETNNAYSLIEYDGSQQVLNLDNGVELHLLGWKDKELGVIIAKVKFSINDVSNEKDIELLANNELISLEVTNDIYVNVAITPNAAYFVKNIKNVETYETFLTIEENENGSFKEQKAILDLEGIIHEWKDVFQFRDSEKNIMLESDYLKLNGTEKIDSVYLSESDNVSDNILAKEEIVDYEVQSEILSRQFSFQTFSPNLENSPSIVYSTHVQTYGWMPEVKDGKISGTEGESKRIEALKINIVGTKDLGIEYSTHVELFGWTEFVADGQISGTESQAKRVEAIKVRLTGNQSDNYDVYYRVHSQTFGWLGWAKNGEPAGTEGLSKRIEAVEIILVAKGESTPEEIREAYFQKPKILYNSFVRGVGWQNPVSDNGLSGTSGQGLALEAINVGIDSQAGIGVRYQTHLQDNGWLNWVENKAVSGFPNEGKRLEAIRMELTGVNSKQYDLYYRVHVQNLGWLGWAKNGESAGSAGYSYRAEAFEVKIVPVGTAFDRLGPAFVEKDMTSVMYTTHIQNKGWLQSSINGETSGTEGQALRLEALKISLNHHKYTGSIEYQAHVQNYGWMNSARDGAISGTTGEALRAEGFKINLIGEISNYYDIYYRTHIQSYGWLGWAKNGMPSGSEGLSKRVESIEIKLIEKGALAPIVTEKDAFIKPNKDIVFLDIGHGGSDPGAQYYGVNEKDLNLQIGQKLKRDLELAGYSVMMSRTDDIYLDYSIERSRIANSSGADIFISLHNNAMPGNTYVNGIETFYYEYDPNYQPKINQLMHNDPERLIRSAVLANEIQKSLIKNTNATDRGVQRDTFAVLRETALPAVLIEFGFMSNLNELNKLQTQEYQSTLSNAVLNGVNNYFKTY